MQTTTALELAPIESPTIDLPTAEPVADVFAAVPVVLRPAMQRRGFASLTSVQEAVLAEASHDRDLRISSQTGSGKTVALGFVLADALQQRQPPRTGPLAMVIAPTRELAQQVKSELEWLFADLRHVAVACVTGGTNVQRERLQLRRQPTVVVGTPGRLKDHLDSGALSGAAIQQLVLDEADQMLDLGFRDELEAILATMPTERRTHLVSATFPTAVLSLADRFQQNPLHIAGTALGRANQDIEHRAHLLAPKQRYQALVNLLLLAGGERTLLFVRTREDTQRLADKLTADGFTAQPLSGELAQTQRNRTLDAFRNGACTTLVATDVAARGLDIEEVHSVIHVDPPMDAEIYVHRSGRTGRAGRKGISVTLVPKSAERRMRRLLQEAKVSVQWLPAPGAGEVRAALEQRQAERLQKLLTASTPSLQQRARAAQLLQQHEPTALVATLLAALGNGEQTAPCELQPMEPTSRPVVTPPFPRPMGQRSEPAELARFVRFRINWGMRDGAEPRRILAHVCRRGDIQSRMVGAIDVGQHETMFEVDAAIAADFAERARELDAREPHLVIAKANGGVAGPRPHQDRAARPQRTFSRPPDHRPWLQGPKPRRPKSSR